MKKMMFTAAALLVLSGHDALAVHSSKDQVVAQRVTPKSDANRPQIPPPVCPANDPHGCGIFD